MKWLVIGAHPDDPELLFGGIALQLIPRGREVVLVSLTDGALGHHQLAPEALRARRALEARASAAALGAIFDSLDIPDGEVVPSLESRLRLIALIRRHAPDAVVTHPPSDYHPDHRYTSQLVADASFLLGVPHCLPEVPALRREPYFFYAVAREAYMDGLSPARVMPIDLVFDGFLRALHNHASQMYEWLPWINGWEEPVPDDGADRIAWLGRRFGPRYERVAELFRNELIRDFGRSGRDARYAQALFHSPLGREVPPGFWNDLPDFMRH